MPDQPIGQLLDSLGVTADIDDGDMATDVLVILKVLQPDGSIAMTIGAPDTRDWVNQLGLLHSALDYTRGGYGRAEDGE